MKRPETWGVQGRTYIRGDLVVRKADLRKLVEEVRADEPEMTDTVQAHAIYFGKNEVLKEIEKLLEGE